MCSELAISVQNLSKCYQIYEKPHDRLKQLIYPRLSRIFGRPPKQYCRNFWAVKDVSFEVNRGETVGIIGKNGSGKSTLLQMICGTLNPTEGEVKVKGRIAALLELGSGFNPEFTGRENIYMNAAILGLSQQEIDARFNDIVSFADIDDFIEQPVRTYSSGMFARLAFAVAINVSPDILIVDEALSVGDSGFQLKCMMRMRELQQRGVTILFVSHDMQAITRFCNRGIVLSEGRIYFNSNDVVKTVKAYEKLTRKHIIDKEIEQSPAPVDVSYQEELGGVHEERFGSGLAKYVSVDLKSELGESTNQFAPNEVIEIIAQVWANEEISDIAAGFSLRDKNGIDIAGDNNIYAEMPLRLPKGHSKIIFRLPLRLVPGDYFLYLGLAKLGETREELDQRWPVRRLSVVGTRKVVGYAYCPAEVELI